jgi:3-oxoacyl-[acyl-carrier protein] reductase
MMQRRFGSIVNMSSLHAIRGQAGRAHYAAAKAAVIGLTKSLAREKGALNIRANAVAPGPIDTPLWRAGRRGPGLRRDMRERAHVIPLGRLGEPEEIAEVIAFLLSARSSYITGAVLTADGGEIMP